MLHKVGSYSLIISLQSTQCNCYLFSRAMLPPEFISLLSDTAKPGGLRSQVICTRMFDCTVSRNCYNWCDRRYPVTVEAHCNYPVTVYRSHMIVSHMFVGHLVSLTATKSCRLLRRPRKCHRWPCHVLETCQLSLTFRTIQDFVKASWPQLPRWRPVIGTVFLLSDLSALSPMWQLSRAVCSSLHIPPSKNIVILDVFPMQ